MLSVANIGYRVILGPSVELHRELLKRDDVRSYYLIERALGKNTAMDANTYIFSSIPNSAFIDRVDRFVAEKLTKNFYEGRLTLFYERHLRELGIDIIHAHFAMTGSRLERVKKDLGLPLVTTFYGVDASECLKSPYWFPKIKRLFEYGDHFVVLSDKIKERFVKNGCDPDKITVWNCLVDFKYPAAPREYAGGDIKLITAARFVEKKGYPFLVQVVKRLADKGLPVKLTAIGYGKDKNKIKALIRRLGLEDRIALIDARGIRNFNDFYNNLLKEHHIFVLTSTTSREGDDEGGPALSLITAQAAGLPVICTPFVGSERSVIDQETGVISDEDIDGFSEKLFFLAGHSELWDKFGTKGSVLVREEFSKSTQTEKVVTLYREILKRRQAGEKRVRPQTENVRCDREVLRRTGPIKWIFFPADLVLFTLLYAALAVFVSILLVTYVLRRKKDIGSKNILQLGHYNFDDIEHDPRSNIVFKSDLGSYFDKVITVLFSQPYPCRVDRNYRPPHRIVNIPQHPDNILERIGLSKTNLAVSALRLFAKCVELVRRENVSLIRAQDPFMLGLAAFVTSACTGVAYTIHVIHNYDVSTRRLQRIVFPPFLFKAVEDSLERAIFRRNIFTTSSYINYRFYAISHGAEEAATFSLKTAVHGSHFKDISLCKDMKRDLGLEDKEMIFYAGRLEKVKFVEDLILCLKEVKKLVGNAVLVLAGTGELEGRLRSLAGEMGILDSVIFLEKVSHERLADLYRSADVNLFTHAGITLVEAALSGKPVAAYDHDWAGEFLGYNERGLLAQFRDVPYLAKCVVRLLKDKDLSSALGAAARDFALAHFNDKAIMDLEISVLERFFRPPAAAAAEKKTDEK